MIVTADHSHTFSIGGYSSRFSDITMEALGIGGIVELDFRNFFMPYMNTMDHPKAGSSCLQNVEPQPENDQK